MGSIVICEKADQAANIKAAIGEQYGRIYPASGHLYALAHPDEIKGEDWTFAGYHVYRPQKWQKVPTPGNDAHHQARLDQARSNIASALKSASLVYIATDCDREGEVIGREILDVNCYRGDAKRVLFNADDPESLREAFAKAVPIKSRDLIYQAGLARERADYIWNFSLSRAATTALIPAGSTGGIGVGRVMTPTLAIVCRRQIQIDAWKPSESHVVKLQLEGPDGAITLTSQGDKPFLNKATASATAKNAIGKALNISVEISQKRQGPPKPPDLTVLQTMANRWGWGADKTLEIGQALYSTHKIMTYVRASTRYYPEPAILDVPGMLTALSELPDLAPHIPASPQIRRGKSGIFCDEALAGESHYALMPNAKTLSSIASILPNLTPDEARLFALVCQLFLQTLMPDHEYESTKITALIDGLAYSGSLRRTTAPGWKAIGATDTENLPAEDPETEINIPLAAGTYSVIGAEARPHKATAPRRYTQGTLIAAMVNAWQYVKDEERQARLKQAKGIGTVATRDEIIRSLMTQSQIVEIKSGAALAPTDAGLTLFGILYNIDPSLVDPATTAEWELQIDEIARGELSLELFLNAIEAETRRLVSKLRQQKANPKFGTVSPPTPAMMKAVAAIQSATGRTPPPGWQQSFALASAYLDANGNKNAKK
jgi:DNA topoisomerase-3